MHRLHATSKTGAFPRIRTVEAGDWDEWLRMRRALWASVGESKHLAEMHEYLRGAMAEAASSTDLLALVVARDARRLGGFLEASLRPYAEDCQTHPVGYIEGWFVDEDLRRQSWGRRLVVEAERWAAANGCREMASDAVIGNQVSLDAHLALGYQESSRVVHLRKFLP